VSFLGMLALVVVVAWLAYQVIAAAVRKGVREGIADAREARDAGGHGPRGA
jgi:peptidoglycan/LPS O-acetylase OafA/YrhL